MYKQGDVKLLDPPCPTTEEDGWCGNDQHIHALDNEWGETFMVGTQCAYLDHTCEDWIIGGPDEVRTMIDDLLVIWNSWQPQ